MLIAFTAAYAVVGRVVEYRGWFVPGYVPVQQIGQFATVILSGFSFNGEVV
jgi:hypothetical protein